MRILIVGGYGVFGGRLTELLSNIPEIDLLICGRDLNRAEAFCARYKGQARVHYPCRQLMPRDRMKVIWPSCRRCALRT
jgi:N-acetyl-gamma-glutamylphosphate reductase